MSTTGKIIIDSINSKLLQDNPLGDSYIRQIPIYLPPGYENNRERYPVVYLLAGFAGRGRLMVNDSIFDENIQERMDRLIATEQAQPMILVMPDCFTKYGGSQYLNSSATGQYETYLIDELVPFVDSHYRTRAEAGYRAIAGKSSGGYGALRLAMRHPYIFSVLACHSGDIYFEYAYKPDFIKFLNATARHKINSYESLNQFLTGFNPKMHPKPAGFFDIIHMSAMSACYSPNPDTPTGFELPFEFYTGLPRPEVWQRWLEKDPISMLQNESYVKALRQMKLVYLDCGSRDEYALQYGARIFCQHLTNLDIPHFYEEFNASHRNTRYRYDLSLKAISDIFG